MRSITKTFMAAGAALPLALALIYPSAGTAQVQQKAVPTSPGGTAPTKTQTAPVAGAAAGGMAQTPSTANPDARPTAPGAQPATGFASPPPTGVCSQGFAKVAEIKGMHQGKQVYTSYNCEGQAPKCPVERAAAEKEPSLVNVQKVAGGPEGGAGSTSFQIRVNYKAAYEYTCGIPAKCLDTAQNGNANSVQVDLSRLGDKVVYKCTYVWNQG